MDDGNGETDTAAVTITVNGPPAADAGPDLEAVERTTVTLDGTGSVDPDGDTLAYAWSQVDGPPVTLAGATTAQPSFVVPDAPASLTFLLTVDDGAGRTSPDTVTVTSQPRFTPTEAWVVHTYQVLLGRSPDTGGLGFWVGRIESGATRSRVATEIGFSDEATRGRVLDQRYRAWLDRRPGNADRDYWASRLLSGTPIRTVEVSILASAELHQRSGGTDIGYIAQVYDLLLGRTPSTSESSYWTARLASHGRSSVAGSILGAVESERRRVADAYDDVLDAPADDESFDYWAEVLATTDDLRRVEVGLAAIWVNQPGSST